MFFWLGFYWWMGVFKKKRLLKKMVRILLKISVWMGVWWLVQVLCLFWTTWVLGFFLGFAGVPVYEFLDIRLFSSFFGGKILLLRLLCFWRWSQEILWRFCFLETCPFFGRLVVCFAVACRFSSIHFSFALLGRLTSLGPFCWPWTSAFIASNRWIHVFFGMR